MAIPPAGLSVDGKGALMVTAMQVTIGSQLLIAPRWLAEVGFGEQKDFPAITGEAARGHSRPLLSGVNPSLAQQWLTPSVPPAFSTEKKASRYGSGTNPLPEGMRSMRLVPTKSDSDDSP